MDLLFSGGELKEKGQHKKMGPEEGREEDRRRSLWKQFSQCLGLRITACEADPDIF